MRIVGAKDVTNGIAVGDNVGITLVIDSLCVGASVPAVLLSSVGLAVPAVLLPSVGLAVGALVGGCTGPVSVGASVF